jgi:hypothetical protein
MTMVETKEITDQKLVWWREVLLAYGFYFAYSRIRGSGRVSGLQPLHNARRIIHWERAIGTYHELGFQRLVLTNEQMVVALNTFYGTAHFMVTPAVAVFLFRKRRAVYRLWRNVLGLATALALVGYFLFPLMPPRLVPLLGFSDTMVRHPSPWKVTPIPIWNIGNPYAAMPSLHVAWSIWVCLALLATTRSVWMRCAACAYPFVTLIAIVATGNHYVLDAVGGALALAAAMALLPVLSIVSSWRWSLWMQAHMSPAFLPGEEAVGGYSPPLWGNSSQP